MEYGHVIKERTAVTSLRMLALCQFVCFYSDILLKRAQLQKQNIKKKEEPWFLAPRLRNIMFLCQENACGFLFLQSRASMQL